MIQRHLSSSKSWEAAKLSYAPKVWCNHWRKVSLKTKAKSLLSLNWSKKMLKWTNKRYLLPKKFQLWACTTTSYSHQHIICLRMVLTSTFSYPLSSSMDRFTIILSLIKIATSQTIMFKILHKTFTSITNNNNKIKKVMSSWKVTINRDLMSSQASSLRTAWWCRSKDSTAKQTGLRTSPKRIPRWTIS